MRKSIYLLTTTPSSHTHRFHPLPLATPTSCSPHPYIPPTLHNCHPYFELCMDDNCGEWVECNGVASGCGEQEVGVASGSGWNLWVWLLGVVVRRYIDFLILYLSLLLLYLFFFTAASLLFVHLKNVFHSCSSTLKKNFFNVLNFFLRSINTYRQLRASHGIHMKVAHTVLYLNKHTQTYASYPAMDISCMSMVYIS